MSLSTEQSTKQTDKSMEKVQNINKLLEAAISDPFHAPKITESALKIASAWAELNVNTCTGSCEENTLVTQVQLYLLHLIHSLNNWMGDQTSMEMEIPRSTERFNAFLLMTDIVKWLKEMKPEVFDSLVVQYEHTAKAMYSNLFDNFFESTLPYFARNSFFQRNQPALLGERLDKVNALLVDKIYFQIRAVVTAEQSFFFKFFSLGDESLWLSSKKGDCNGRGNVSELLMIHMNNVFACFDEMLAFFCSDCRKKSQSGVILLYIASWNKLDLDANDSFVMAVFNKFKKFAKREFERLVDKEAGSYSELYVNTTGRIGVLQCVNRLLWENWLLFERQQPIVIQVLASIFNSGSLEELLTFESEFVQTQTFSENAFVESCLGRSAIEGSDETISSYVTASVHRRMLQIQRDMKLHDYIVEGWQSVENGGESAELTCQMANMFSFRRIEMIQEFEVRMFLENTRIFSTRMRREVDAEKMYVLDGRPSFLQWCYLDLNYFNMDLWINYQQYILFGRTHPGAAMPNDITTTSSQNSTPSIFYGGSDGYLESRKRPQLREEPYVSLSTVASHCEQLVSTSSSIIPADFFDRFSSLNHSAVSQITNQSRSSTSQRGEQTNSRERETSESTSEDVIRLQFEKFGDNEYTRLENMYAQFKTDSSPDSMRTEECVEIAKKVLTWMLLLAEEQKFNKLAEYLVEISQRIITDEELLLFVFANQIKDIDCSANFVVDLLEKMIEERNTE